MTSLTPGWKEVARIARRALRRPARLVRRQVLPRVIPPASAFPTAPTAHGHVVGLLSSASGLGKSARLCIESLRRAKFPVSTENVASLFDSDDGITFPSSRRFVPNGFAIYHLNPPMLLPGIVRSGLTRYYRSYNIGYWAWELESLPPEWIAALRFMHAIIVPSRFCQTAVRRYTAKPVRVVPHPIWLERDDTVPRVRADGKFRVINVFRFGSSFERKNPIALVRAFHLAFGDDARVELVLKTSDGARFPQEFNRLRAAIGASNVVLIDEVWPERRVADLMQSADVYASLHRSEGFGLPLAEALMAGVPVIATNWSGSTDFVTAQHSFPVEYKLIPFCADHGDYEQVRGARWAEPSVHHAAEQLRRVRNDPDASRRKANAARDALLRHSAAHGYQSALAAFAGQSLHDLEPAFSASGD